MTEKTETTETHETQIINVNLPTEVANDISELASQLKQTPEEFIQMALSLLMQSNSLDNILASNDRIEDQKTLEPIDLGLVDDPADELSDISLEIHPDANEEFNFFDEDQKAYILSALIDRITMELDEEEDLFDSSIDLVIQESEDHQLLLSSFDFGEIVYTIGDKLVIYLLDISEHFNWEASDEDEDEITNH